MIMTKEEKAKYQKLITYCMKNEIPVLYHGKRYMPTRMCFGFQKQTKSEYIAVEIADLNGCSCLMTVDIEEIYKENCKEENKSEQTSKM